MKQCRQCPDAATPNGVTCGDSGCLEAEHHDNQARAIQAAHNERAAFSGEKRVPANSDHAPCPLCGVRMVWIDEPKQPEKYEWCHECRDDLSRLLDRNNARANAFREALMAQAGELLQTEVLSYRSQEDE